MALVCILTTLRLLMDLSIPCSWFYLLERFSVSPRCCFCWGAPFCCSASTSLWNVEMASSMLLFSLWNLTVSLLLSPRTLSLSWVMSLSITVCSSREFRRITTSRNTSAKLSDNEVVSTGYQYSPNPFQYGKSILPYSSILNVRMDAYKASIFYGFVVSSSPVGNTTFIFFSSP